MFDTHVDTLYVWVALGTVSVAVFGVVVSLPASAPPDATATAATVDEVATSPAGSVATRELDAVEWSLSDREIGLRSDGGVAHATVFEPFVPALDGRLAAVLEGGRPSRYFGSPTGLRRAAERARTADTGWRPAPERLTVRHVAWGGVDVTLVG
ncbi:hypothetical protein NDI85_06275 [Halomicroarcula sp. S1AR25-4]|uniref:DUF7283 family protein n=1 Tax=Haloarcula sp. S1AR25-4 TaxID=2950538 RepID=UPI0028750687|nr:hypothetical protein [Halomicroarcula sp. S1AR25-4]MDS0277392.1 hypothetical protein [Halomicroarcula sp. S1AR25-4]